MSLKAKLVSTIAAVCMVICLLSVGIFAATTGTVNVGGTVSFSATNVDVTITGSISGAKDNTWADGATGVTWDAKNTTETVSVDWKGLNLAFVQNEQGGLDDIVISLVVTNNNEERGVAVTLTDNTEDSALNNVEVQLSKTSDTLTSTTATESKKATETYTITLHPTVDANQSASATFDVSLAVTNT